MPDTPPIRRRDKDSTRAGLLDAARTVLADSGFQGFGVNAIARQAGCDKALIYRYFGGVDGLLAAIGEDIAGWTSTIAPSAPAATYAEWITGLADAYIVALRDNRLLQKILLWELSAPQAEVAPLAEARGRAMREWMARSRGELPMPPDAGLTNAILIAAIHQFVLSGSASGHFSGLPLGTDADWDRVRSGIRMILARLYPA